MAGSDSSSIPADSPKLKGVFIWPDFNNWKAGDNAEFWSGEGKSTLSHLTFFEIWGVDISKSFAFFEVLKTLILLSEKGFFWYKKHIICKKHQISFLLLFL